VIGKNRKRKEKMQRKIIEITFETIALRQEKKSKLKVKISLQTNKEGFGWCVLAIVDWDSGHN